MTRAFAIAIVALLCAPVLEAQAPTPTAPSTRVEDLARSGQAPASSPSQAPENTAPVPPASYVYAAEGRRDPFVPAVGRGLTVAPAMAARRPPGVAGLMTADFVVRGVIESQGAWVAMVRATDGRTYSMRAGDRLMDGTVRAITADAVVILQEVNDPLSNAKQREVRKVLRGGPEVQ